MQQVSDDTTTFTDKLPEFICQRWSDYTAEQHDVWGLLYQRRMKQLATDGSRVFLDGAKVIGLKQDTVPDLADVNARLNKMTGWNAVPAAGALIARIAPLLGVEPVLTVDERDKLEKTSATAKTALRTVR